MSIQMCGRKPKQNKRKKVKKGDMYGYWEVLEESCPARTKTKTHIPYALCRCLLCGEEYPVNKNNLKALITTRCTKCARHELSQIGINARKLYAEQRGRKEVGRVYGSWKVLSTPSYEGADGRRLLSKAVLCRCICGRTAYLRLYNLKKNACSKQCRHKTGTISIV